MRHMNYGKSLSAAALLLAFGFLLGCGGGDPASVSPDQEPGGTTAGDRAASENVGGNAAGVPEHSSEPDSDSEPAPIPDPADDGTEKDDIEVASPDPDAEGAPHGENQEGEAGADAQDLVPANDARHNSNKRKYDVNVTFDPAHPTLMGLNTQSTAESVQTRFGEPVMVYSLPDESSNATVYAYPGFTVGVSGGCVLFVDVSSPAINPGLNGFRVGGTVDDAVAAIGKPSSRSEYVLTYVNDGIILKLDVDPKTRKIQSIKLFPED